MCAETITITLHLKSKTSLYLAFAQSAMCKYDIVHLCHFVLHGSRFWNSRCVTTLNPFKSTFDGPHLKRRVTFDRFLFQNQESQNRPMLLFSILHTLSKQDYYFDSTEVFTVYLYISFVIAVLRLNIYRFLSRKIQPTYICMCT